MNNEKLIKTAKTSYTIVNILQKFMIAAIVLIVLAAAVIVFASNAGAPIVYNSLNIGNISLELSDSYSQNYIGNPRMLAVLLSAAASAAVLYYGFSVLKTILRPMKEGRPFDTSVSSGIRKLGYTVLFGGLIQQFTEFLTDRLFLSSNLEMIQNLFKEGAVQHIQINSSFSLDFVFAALLLFLLSYVFRYGEELQEQSDETL